jgi:hypothetical protein
VNVLQKNVFVSQEELNIQKDFSEKVHSILNVCYPYASPKAFIHTYGCQGNVADS